MTFRTPQRPHTQPVKYRYPSSAPTHGDDLAEIEWSEAKAESARVRKSQQGALEDEAAPQHPLPFRGARSG